MPAEKADFVLVPPQTNDPNELIQFECQHCEDWVLSSDMEVHMSYFHLRKHFTVNTSMRNLA